MSCSNTFNCYKQMPGPSPVAITANTVHYPRPQSHPRIKHLPELFIRYFRAARFAGGGVNSFLELGHQWLYAILEESICLFLFLPASLVCSPEDDIFHVQSLVACTSHQHAPTSSQQSQVPVSTPGQYKRNCHAPQPAHNIAHGMRTAALHLRFASRASHTRDRRRSLRTVHRSSTER